MSRKSPIRHPVSSHDRSNAHVQHYIRGAGRPISEAHSTPSSSLQLIQNSQNKVMVTYPEHTVSYRMILLNPSEIDFSETKQDNLERRSEYFIDMYKRGKQIPPILVHQKPDGRYEVIDGHARLEAYKKMDVKVIPV